jgi:hypothetical protein
MLGISFRKRKTGATGREVRSMGQEDAIAFFADLIRPRAAFAADQFFLKIAGMDGKKFGPDLGKAAIAMRATVHDFVLEYADLSKLRDRDQAQAIAHLQVVGVDAFLERFFELHRQKALVAQSQTGKAN